MDQASLVDLQLDDGQLLLCEMTCAGVEVVVGCWVKEQENTRWKLFIGLKDATEQTLVAAAEAIRATWMRHPSLVVTGGDYQLVPKQHPVVKQALELQKQRSESALIRYHTDYFGGLEVEEVYIYPRITGQHLQARTRVLGIREQVEEELGVVEGLVGDEVFHRRFTDLVRLRFGSAEQFAAAYPCVVFQKLTS